MLALARVNQGVEGLEHRVEGPDQCEAPTRKGLRCDVIIGLSVHVTLHTRTAMYVY